MLSLPGCTIHATHYLPSMTRTVVLPIELSLAVYSLSGSCGLVPTLGECKYLVVSWRQNKFANTRQEVIAVLSVSTVLCFEVFMLSTAVMTSFEYANVKSQWLCEVTGYILPVLYGVAKTLRDTVLLSRLYYAYIGSMFAYQLRTCVLWIAWAVIAGWIGVLWATAKAKSEYGRSDESTDKHKRFCNRDYGTIGVLIGTFVDITFTLVTLYMFVKVKPHYFYFCVVYAIFFHSNSIPFHCIALTMCNIYITAFDANQTLTQRQSIQPSI